MATRITRELVESYIHCKYKAHLKGAGQQGTPSDYGALLTSQTDEVRRKVTEKVLARHQEDEVARAVPLTAATLSRGPLYVLEATLEEDLFSYTLRD